jgi:hypothetical protein
VGTVTYLATTKFSTETTSDYEVEIDENGLYVYSECCGDRMSVDTLRKVVEAGARFLADRDRPAPAEPDPNALPFGGSCPTCGTTVESFEGEPRTAGGPFGFIEVMAVAYVLKPCGHPWAPPVARS